MTMLSYSRTVLLIFWVACAACAACSYTDGTDPYALWQIFEHPTEAFHFHYPSPPWETAEDTGPERAVLVVDPDTDEHGDDHPNARLRLEVWVINNNPVADVVSYRCDHWEGLGYQVDPPKVYWNDALDEGIRVEATDGQYLRVTEVFYPLGGRTALLSLWVKGESDRSDLELLIEGFEPRGSGE
jgi:hypothetical protein